MSADPSVWRRHLPPRGAWVRLVATPSAYLLVFAALVTLVAKAGAVGVLPGAGVGAWLRVILIDVAVYFGVAAAFAVLERRSPWAQAFTVPVALGLAAVGIVNALLLGAAGEQLTLEAVDYGLARWDDLWIIAGERVDRLGAGAYLWPLLGLAVPVAVRVLLGRRVGPWQQTEHADQVARATALVALPALLLTLVWPAPSSAELRRLAGSAPVRLVAGLATPPPAAAGIDWTPGAGFLPGDLVDESAAAAFAARADRPNVLLVVLESTRRDATSLVDRPLGPVATPTLEALAARGFEATHTRAALPHTTKSLFSMLCARLPTLQQPIYETSGTLRLDCLPRRLAQSGYATAFFQSATGAFEERPRLVENLGYGHFAGWEDIGGEFLGYLASDDESLVAPVLAWIDAEAASGRPFFATVLTSATHDPYRLSKRAAERAAASGAATGTATQRYLRLVEAEDLMLGALVDGLAARGQLGRTIIVVVGDHGEGFGDKGVLQHDNNFYEEGLRVPFVIAGPGVTPGRSDANTSVLDVTPTILGVLGLGVRTPPAEGFDMRAADFPRDAPRWFGCLYKNRCEGFVVGTKKVVAVPEEGEVYVYDLAADPGERSPRAATKDLEPLLLELVKVMNEHRLVKSPPPPDRDVRFGAWHCPPLRICKHPVKAPGL